MQADTNTGRTPYGRPGQTDFTEILDDVLRCLKRYWIQLLLLMIAAAAVTVAYFNFTYKPVYSAKITYAVSKTGDTATDASIAKRLSRSVETITKSDDFLDELSQEMGEQEEEGNFWFTSQYTEGANLFTVSVNSDSFGAADPAMEAFRKIYPSWVDRTNGSVELETVDRISASENPDNPYSLPKFAGMGILAGLLLAVLLGAFYTQTLRTVRREKDMKPVTARGCLAQVPETRMKKRSQGTKAHLLISNKRIDWGFKQSLLSVQSRLDLQMDKNGQKILLVTSTLPQEGKTMTAVNLALAAAENGKKTIVIDGDMRNPSVGRILGMEEKTPGLSDFFDNMENLDGLITEHGSLSVLTAGTKSGAASGILSDTMMKDLIRYLKKTYDFIVIDSPPSGLFSDAAIYSGYADAVLYVVRYDMASVNEIREGIAPFTESEKLLGYVINRSRGSIASYGRYGKYGYSRYGRYGKYKRYIKADEASMNTEDSL